MPLNINVLKEFIIIIMGPLFQNIAYVLLILFFKEKELILRYHLGILIFNLLPIYPLDGGKLLKLLFNNIIPYKLSYKVVIVISYFMAILILFSNNKLSINMIITYILLIFLIRREEIKTDFIYNKFLLERYLNSYSYRKRKIIKSINSFYRTRNNVVKKNNILYDEHDILRKKYKNFY